MSGPGLKGERVDAPPAAVHGPRPCDLQDGRVERQGEPGPARRVGHREPAGGELGDERELPGRWVGRAGDRQVERSVRRRKMRPGELGPGRHPETWVALVEDARPTGDLDPGARPNCDPGVDPPHERHRLIADVRKPVARPHERLAGPDLHPSVDPERGDDARTAQLESDCGRRILGDPGSPGLRPELAEERQRLAVHDARVTGRGDLVDPTRPPVVDVSSEDRRPDIEPRMVVQEVSARPLRDELGDLGAVARQDRRPDPVVLQHDRWKAAVRPVGADRGAPVEPEPAHPRTARAASAAASPVASMSVSRWAVRRTTGRVASHGRRRRGAPR